MKKTISLILCIVISLTACTAAFAGSSSGKSFYIDSVSGNDEADGSTPETAWKTVSRLNGETFSAGDNILFKRGCTFSGTFSANGSGTESEPITVSAYGEGADPVFSSEDPIPLFMVIGVSNWIFENLELTAPQGIGMMIYGMNGNNVENITVRNCYFHDISPDGEGTNCCSVYLNMDRSGARLHNIHLDSLRIENTSWAIHCSGVNAENDKDIFRSPDEDYSSDYVFENIYIKNAKRAGIVVAAVKNCHIRNCRILDCATAQESAFAPLWIRHSKFVTVEYCEIAGSTNKTDGMAIDFDGWTTDSVYRYIYSHDNTRFIKNCVFDNVTYNAGNEVCNCVSVNDNEKMNWSAISLISSSAPSFAAMRNFSFHDNIIVNGSPILWIRTPLAKIENVTFIGSVFSNLLHRFFNLFSFSTGFNYRADGDISELIEEITKDLPEY